MKTRLISAIIALPILIVPVYLGGLSLYIVMTAALLLGIYEFNHAFGIKDKWLYAIPMVSTLGYMVTLWLGNNHLFVVSITFLVLAELTHFVKRYPKDILKHVMISSFSFFYITVMLSHILMIRDFETYGVYLVWLVFTVAFGSDTFAYLVGKTLGKKETGAGIKS